MNCFDCSSAGHATAAVAICNSCGAGACAEHATSRPPSAQRTNGPGRTPLARSARQIRCLTCSAVHSSS